MRTDLHRQDRRVDDAQIRGIIDLELGVDDS